MSFVSSYQSSVLTENARLARIRTTDKIHREVSLSAAGGRISCAINGLILGATFCICHLQFDGYGVALGAIIVLSSLQSSAMLCTIGQMSKYVRVIYVAVGVTLQGRRRAALLGAAREMTSAWGERWEHRNSNHGCVGVALDFDHAKDIAPGSDQIAGLSVTQSPIDHVTDDFSFDLEDLMLPMVLGVGIAAASAASVIKCGTAIRREILHHSTWESIGEDTTQKKSVQCCSGRRRP